MLDDLDKELKPRGHRFARYADDFIILVKSQRAAATKERVCLLRLERLGSFLGRPRQPRGS